MAKKTFQFPVTIGVPDASAGTPEIRDTDGRLVAPASMGLRYIAPGEPVEMDEAEAIKLLAKTGPYIPLDVPPAGMPRQTLGSRRT